MRKDLIVWSLVLGSILIVVLSNHFNMILEQNVGHFALDFGLLGLDLGFSVSINIKGMILIAVIMSLIYIWKRR